MKKAEARRKLAEIEYQYEVENRASNINRARSITVGKTTDGLTEVLMRSDGGRYIWYVMGTEEAIGFIYQLASNIGCTIDIEPRQTLMITTNVSRDNEHNSAENIENKEYDANKARSISAGTAFGGATEILLRADRGQHIWCIMQPVELVEFINQLVANIGYTSTMKPRRDFSSWRDWRVTPEEIEHFNGFPPFVNDMAPLQQIGANMQKHDNMVLIEKINQLVAHHQQELREISTPTKSSLITDSTVDQAESTISMSTVLDGAPNVDFNADDLSLINKVTHYPDGSMHIFGGAGGNSDERIKQFKKTT